MATEETLPKLNIQMATQAAQAKLKELQEFMGGEISDVRLEEVELSEDDQLWRITLSFNRPADQQNQLMLTQKMQRDYKLFEINAETGAVKAMKIRQL